MKKKQPISLIVTGENENGGVRPPKPDTDVQTESVNVTETGNDGAAGAAGSKPAVATTTANVSVLRPSGTTSFKDTHQPGRMRRIVVDKIATVVVTVCFVLAMLPLVSLLWITIENGAGRLFHRFPYFLNVSMNGVFGGMDAGGIYHAILGTLIVTGWATLISVPIGVMTAVYLVEYGRGKMKSAITFFVDVMTGIPSIVAGLFAAALFTLLVGPAYRAGIMGAVALSVLMVPTVVRGSEEMLRLVPHELREAAYALGVPKWLVIIKVVLRTAAAGLTTTVMLAIARVVGETAPLLLTVGVFNSINANAFSGRMMTLPVYVYRQYSQGLVPCPPAATECLVNINYDRAWAAALVLVIIVMGLNLIARITAKLVAPKGK